ncbi:MAG: type II secretion system protein GspJ [Bdellovibrionales bacterium]
MNLRLLSRGFTLLEILIAMAILAFVTIFTAQSISTALRNRTKIQGEIDRVGTVRDALKVMENDINKAFHHNDINIALYNAAAKERNRKIEEAKKGGSGAMTTGSPAGGGTTTTTGGVTTPTQNPYALMEPLKLKEEKILTQFMGEAEKLDFTSLSNARISSEERSSDQAEIGYFLKDCKSRRDRKKSSRCLYRRVSTIIDDDVTTGGDETALIENVQKLEFRYLGPPSPPEWINLWLTNDRGDDRTKNVFPYAVEVTLEVHDVENKTAKPVRMTMVAGIRNPNNKDKNAEAEAQSAAAAGMPSGPGSARTGQ